MRNGVELKFKGYATSLGVAFVFYLVNLPKMQGVRDHLEMLALCFLYGTVIYFCIFAAYAAQRAILDKRPAGANRRISMPAHFLIAISGSTVGLWICQHVEGWYYGKAFKYGNLWEAMVLSSFIALMFQFYFAWKRSQEDNLILKAAKAEAELHALRNQMQPHFLFNSLNSLAALIDSDTGAAGEATQKLADLYRLILDCSKSPLSPLEREVQIARLYLEIERIRFGSRLSIQTPTLSPNERDLLVPSLVIQTLVENAVKHGIAGCLEGGFVHLTVRREPGGLRVEILNSGTPLGETRGGGTGLRNTQERLSLTFGAAHGFRLERNADGLTSAGFLIPEKA